MVTEPHPRTPEAPAWTRSYAEGVPAEVEVPRETVPDLLTSAAQRFPDRPALEFFGATTSYAELRDAVARAATVLRDLGVRQGDRVALVLPNCPQHVVAFNAVLRLGAVVVEHNPLYTAEELGSQFRDHGATVAVVWNVVAPVVQQLDAPELREVLAVDLSRALPLVKRLALRLPVPKARATRAAMTKPAPGTTSWDAVVADATPLEETHPGPAHEDVALLQYTGGTTGSPKAAVLTHRNLVANVTQSLAWVPQLRAGEEVLYGVLPMFHAYGVLLCLAAAVRLGAVLVLFPRFDVDQVLAAAKKRPPTFFPGVPPMYQRLAAAAEERGVDLSGTRVAISGAMPLPLETAELWERVTGGLVVEGYGMTEASPIVIGNPVGPTRRPGTVGLPFPSTRMRVVDPEDPTVDRAPGERGELLVQGPQVFSGYWNRPEETAAVLLPGGWLRTGDVVEVDDDGFVRIVDRIKELIITGGFNVYPSEVEEVLKAVDGITDAAVVGLPGKNGEDVVAAVVLERELDLDAVRESIRASLAGYKVPRRIVAVDDLPRSQIGKVLRRDVRDQLLAD
ncbi:MULTISPECIES: long-chain-fatty-acid--CoA ligase [unclassified Modestobacter]|uniref:long-chain-fatty-acid--CoA ligase n=1 Tax=unclassified Modestobacter TaxID=2643866 RepID=UPI0022AA7E05|nr:MULTISPECIES: long-chain-fatty-acid--CoA ligase [unclassified Modestobacter]MCZ2826389.1 long-chain-fatty-acid--CoA ligase [Modestobacter sp. VKM Ac-2981]MCZ2852546.1 long-chain-fatty-acid--CoA ligase [Modestobacter sp. VKM Ac-2982]